jgi:hypothetical protein
MTNQLIERIVWTGSGLSLILALRIAKRAFARRNFRRWCSNVRAHLASAVVTNCAESEGGDNIVHARVRFQVVAFQMWCFPFL